VQTLASCINGEKITPVYLSSICTRLASFKKQKSTKVEDIEEEDEEEQESFHQPESFHQEALPFKAAPPMDTHLAESFQSDIQPRSIRSVSHSPVQEEFIKQAVERALPTSKGNNIEARLDYLSVKQELGEVVGESVDSKAVLLLEALGTVRGGLSYMHLEFISIAR
jgi:hypothetical protein